MFKRDLIIREKEKTMNYYELDFVAHIISFFHRRLTFDFTYVIFLRTTLNSVHLNTLPIT